MTSPERIQLLQRANYARTAIRELGLDPALALSYVVWPTPKIERAYRIAA